MTPVATVRRDRLCGQRLGVPRRPPVVASLCREVAVEEFRGRWVVARSATGPDDFVNGYLTPAGCFGDRARSSRAGKACDASTLLYGHAVRQCWYTSGTQNLLICLQASLWTTPKQGLRGGEQGKQVHPFPQALFKDLHITLPTLERFSREFRVSLLSDSPPQRDCRSPERCSGSFVV